MQEEKGRGFFGSLIYIYMGCDMCDMMCDVMWCLGKLLPFPFFLSSFLFFSFLFTLFWSFFLGYVND